MEELEKKFTTETLLKKIPPEKCWEITANILTNVNVMRAIRVRYLLATEEGVIAPIMAWEQYSEINMKIFAEGGKKLLPWVKETFNLQVEDAIDAAKLVIIAAKLLTGPELENEIVEGTAKRAVGRTTKCAWWERNTENGLTPELMICPAGDQAWGEEGLKAINPKLSYKVSKAMPWGDPYCEFVYEFKEE